CYSTETVILERAPKLVKLGFGLELPQGYEAVIRPRSGLSKKGVTSAIGTIDANFRGEISACMSVKTGTYQIFKGDRICQLAIRKTEEVEFEEVAELTESERGENGFGSTGLK
ncbi:MAG: deoxyuridine 5'-triphosphate nucleotidohydrolase, partial [Fibrobacter sp.]|nr:deoxyuridine 5'-triphosphate nucleotidohydrolase [Fibrobacter sp.]